MSEEKKQDVNEELEKQAEAEEAAKDAAGEKAEEAAEDKAAEEQKAEAAAEAKADEAQQESEKYARLFAEFQNYKRRTEKEKADLYAYAGEKFAADLLEVVDSFERAMAAKPEDDKFADGMEMILTQLKAVLAKNHVEEIEALGKPFDPNLHNAVMTEAAEEGTESGTVTKVFQKGYTLNSKVIRHAMVAVSQ